MGTKVDRESGESWSLSGVRPQKRVRLVHGARRTDLVVQIGVAPNRIDLLTSIDGIEFEEAWETRITTRIGGVEVPVFCLAELLRNKRAVGRLRDLADVEELERSRPEQDCGISRPTRHQLHMTDAFLATGRLAAPSGLTSSRCHVSFGRTSRATPGSSETQ